ncbi:YitT family protein [Alkalicoccobacillus plakortidis]|uniref:YitT family protein n=1 Tax=Alkalicoccobacillus plakortidis TaxID=444060 RepID=A0ABT0XPV7_9BACI|nr:YitT family protein [Alkalicoccobacillus plakortidis]MCM2677944.1 YitT family protein [Alkalicoccobacillus plakortidis]
MKNYILMISGTLIIALSITLLAMPHSIADGGILGIALLIYYAIGVQPSIVVFGLFVVIMLASYKFLSKSVILKTLVTVPLLSFFTYLTEPYGIKLEDPLVAAIFFGLVSGVGFGLVIYSGSSVGGTSTIALMLKKKFGLDVIFTAFIMDVIVVLAGVLIIGVLNTLYTVIALFIGKVASDYVIGGLDSKKAFIIVSSKNDQIAKKVVTNLASSATYINGKGVYANQEQQMLYILVKNHRVMQLRRIINEIDPQAFVVVNNVKDVSGGTFFGNANS